MAGNYDKMEQDARNIFLRADQQSIIDTWQLESDESCIYVDFFSQRLRIDRKTAVITAAGTSDPEDPAGNPAASMPERFPIGDTFGESLVIFDIITRKIRPFAAGSWGSVSSLGGNIGAGHDQRLSNEPDAAKFKGQTERLRRACESLGGRPFGNADAGYSIPVFKDLNILFTFWDADDEFPASIKYLFDANVLQYMHYETLWYLMGACLDRVEFAFRNIDL